MKLYIVVFGPDSICKEPPYQEKPFVFNHILNRPTGTNPFAFIPKDMKDGIVTVELDNEFLFSNQFNTFSGYRLFDYAVHDSMKKGYFLDLDSKMRLDEMRSARYACGYCGKQYVATDAESESHWCHNCLGSRYLREDELWLTELFPVLKYGINDRENRMKNHSKVPQSIIDIYRRKQRESLIKRKRLFIQKQHEKIKEIEHETEVLTDVYNRGIDPTDVDAVYYKHSHKLSFNSFQKGISDEDVAKIKQKMEGFDKCKWEIK